ncbi:MAG: nitrate ABC transporter, permease protein, partial [Burkholderiaceae bacterium]
MVSAVFHSPLETAAADVAVGKHGAQLAAIGAASASAAATQAVVRLPSVWREWALKILPPIAGLALLIAVWGLLTRNSTTFPTPWDTFEAAVKLFSDPFYDKGPNDQGIGWNVLFSLERVALGFGLAAVVGIPLGFVIGR